MSAIGRAAAEGATVTGTGRDLDGPATVVLVGAHLAALACLVVRPTRTAAALFFVFYYLAGLGVTVGFHRYLSHRGFRCGTAMRRLWATLGTLALQGGPVFWVGLHRRHHQFTDRPGDPHSPTQRMLEGHMLWIVRKSTKAGAVMAMLQEKDLRELGRDPYIKQLDRSVGPLLPWLASLAVCYGLGGLSGLVWGGFLRTVLVWHSIWIVNSVAHRFGARPRTTRDGSRDVWWLSPFTLGEQWHNSHHADPRTAVLTDTWWRFDVSGWIILALEKVGLVHHVMRRARSLEPPVANVAMEEGRP